MTLGSLFSGIGGLDLGLERAGMIVRWQVERDAFASKVLAKHWPGVARHPDVKEVGAANLQRVDCIAGGFPCQDISVAGKGAGLDGARSGLWSEFARIVRELRPRFVVVENVPALLARGLGRVLGDLAASGYDAEWDCIPAAAVGAPHLRDRLFVVAYAYGQSVREQSVAESGGGGAGVAGYDGESEYMADADVQRREKGIFRTAGKRSGTGNAERCGQREMADAYGVRELQPEGRVKGQWRRPRDSGWWSAEPDVGGTVDGVSAELDGGGLDADAWESSVPRVARGIPRRVDRLRGLGNAVVPQVAEHIGRIVMAAAASVCP